MIILNDTTFERVLADLTGAAGPGHFAGWMVQTNYGIAVLQDDAPGMVALAIEENNYDWNYHWDTADVRARDAHTTEGWYGLPEHMEVSPIGVLEAAATSTVRRRFETTT